MSTEEKIVWTRVSSQPREAVLVGRCISSEWLKGSVTLVEIRLGGKTRQAFEDVMAAAKAAKLNFPIMSLRTAMICNLENVVTVDRDLGLIQPDYGPVPAAVELFSQLDDEEACKEVCANFAQTLRRWVIDDVMAWAEQNAVGDLAPRLLDAVSPKDVSLTPSVRPYIKKTGRPDFRLITQILAKRLVGEVLFEGMGECEIVAFPDPNSNVVELMTLPRVSARNDVFSMVARVRVSSVPYSNNVFLSVSAVKRVWAKRKPGAFANMPRSVIGYVVSIGRPVTPISIRRTDEGWVFGEEYAALYRASNERLPQTLDEAIEQREYSRETGWWVGLPELPSLFKSLSPRTVFEGDEVDLLHTVCKVLQPIVTDKPVAVREVRRGQAPTRPLQEMLKMSDCGLAGASLAENEDDDLDGEGGQQERTSRKERIAAYREQNTQALKLGRGDEKPTVWMLGGGEVEINLTRRSIELLFGDAVEFKSEPLPQKTHGLRAVLDPEALPSRARFEKRVSAWEPATAIIRSVSGNRPTIVLVCAPDRINKKPEDPVNYYAGIHAMSQIGANVHYVLPLESVDNDDDRQNFLHRVQSALLDVLLAHSGLVFGVKEFVANTLPADKTPNAIYGVQAVRSRARSRTGESSVSFVLFSRLIIETGKTEIQIWYKEGRNQFTHWMPLSEGLNWIGRKRNLQDSDERWLRASFNGIVKDALKKLSEEDPQAIVLIDWRTVSGLWKGIRDEDLGAGEPPRLDMSSLAVFKGMTFIRLRRSDDTMALRAAKSALFRAWKIGAADRGRQLGEQLGEQTTESYFTTERNIVEIVDSQLPEHRNYRHFVASMGYAKTVQIPRGLSCYRQVTRMKRLAVGAAEFEQQPKEPATVDAALPAPIDITVMSCPDGVSPDLYASLVMGLRLGYAHYNDWTGLPAPLFFRRKVDDYIIRYAEERDEDAVLEAPDRNESKPPEPAPKLLDVVDELVGVPDTAPEALLEVDKSEEDIPLAGARQYPVGPSEEGTSNEDLIKLMREMPLISLAYEAIEDRHINQLYQRMIRGFNTPAEIVQVRVSLPFWVKAKGLIESELPISKRAIRQAWDRMFEFGYVGVGRRMPENEPFFDWLARHLVCPQAGSALWRIRRHLGGMTFAPMAEIIRNEFNPTQGEDKQIHPVRYDIESLERMAAWADEHSHDALMGWLLFMSTQAGNPEWCESVFKAMTHIPGSRTLHAIFYCVASAKAIDELRAHKGNFGTFKAIYIRLPEVVPAEPEEAEHKPENTVTAAASVVATSTNISKQDPFMAAKNKLIRLIEQIAPGTEGFGATLDDIEKALHELAGMHEAELNRQLETSAVLKRMDGLLDQQLALVEKIEAEREELMIDGVAPKLLVEAQVDQIAAELAAIEEGLASVTKKQEALASVRAMPAQSVADRKRVTALKQQAENNLVECVESLHETLSNSICFSLLAPSEDPPGGGENDSAEAASTSVAEVAPALAVLAEVLIAASAKPASVIDTIITAAPAVPEVAAPEIKTPLFTTPETHAKVSVQMQSAAADPKAPAPVVQTETLKDVIDTSPASATEKFDHHVGVLHALLRQRLYGLASVHAAAIGRMVGDLRDDRLISQHAILQALVGALDGMDCQFSFDMRLNEGLNTLLSAEKLPSCPLSERAPMALGILAAGIGNMLFDDSDVSWRIGNAISSRLLEYPALSALVDHLDTIRQRGYLITRDVFIGSRIGDKAAIGRELERFSRRAAEWKNAPEIHRSFNHRGFKALHEEMFSPKNPIGACLAFIAKGDAARVRTAYDEAIRKFEKASATVDELFKKIGERTRPEGTYRVQVIENIERTGKFIKSYLEHVERGKSQGGELPRDKQEFLVTLYLRLTESIVEIKSIEAHLQTEQLYCDAAIKSLSCVLRLYESQDADVCISNEKQKLLIQLPMGYDLLPAMGSPDGSVPALCLPEDVLVETQHWSEASLTLDREGDGEDIDTALREAFDRHLEAKRFMPAFRIERLIKPLLPPGINLPKRYNIERDALTAELQEARQRVTHAMTLSALPVETETNRMQRIIEELLSLVRSDRTIGHSDGDSVAYPDFPQARAALRVFVLNPLEGRLMEAKAKLERELAEEAEKEGVLASDIDRIRQMLESNNAATLRTAHDALGMLKQSKKLPAFALSASFDMAGEYTRFMASVHAATANRPLLEGIKDLLKDEPKDFDPEWARALDVEQRVSAIELIDLWGQFFAKRSLSDQDLTDKLFREMGVPQAPMAFPESGRPQRGKLDFGERAFVFQTQPDDPLFIPPSLGSWATHIQGFVLYGNTTDNDLRLLMQEVGTTPTFVFMRAKLSMAKRAQILVNVPAIIVDEELIAYMALHPNERFQSMMKVGMLTYSTNPFDDYNSRPVPPEMFFGRQDELRQLQSVKSLAVLYGGRRLGKSSLLSQIEREDSQIPGHQAVYISMQTVDVVGDHVCSAWEFICRALAGRKIIPHLVPMPHQWKQIRDHVEKGVMAAKNLKSIYLLIDEADKVMGRDLKARASEARFVPTLVQFTDDVGHAIQVRSVIAGLHNITRMTTEENSVFGKADAIALKPFSTAEDVQRGIRLITKPLAAMGYLFGPGAQDLPLRILAVCNFYPAFIQLYCRRLVEQLQNNRQCACPPFYITAKDLDAVEADSTLLANLREKFRYNLDLDKRYKVIALILADVYYTEIDKGHYLGLTASEIPDYCELYGGVHFQNTGHGVYEALLDEMMKLNIIERVGTRYVLRNPQIAMMIGDRERIKLMIDDLIKQPPELVRSHGEQHIAMTHGRAAVEFPMPLAWIRRHMDTSDGELLILSGNAVSGIQEIGAAERHDWKLQDYFVVPVPGMGPMATNDVLDKMRRNSTPPGSRMLLVRTAGWKIDQIAEYAAVAKKGVARIVLLADPVRSFELAQWMQGQFLHGIEENRNWRVVPIPPWSGDAVYFRVGENVAVAESDEALKALMTATCGFGRELLKVPLQSISLQQALAAPVDRRKSLAPNFATFYTNVGLPAACTEDMRRNVENFLSWINGEGKQSDVFAEAALEFSISDQMFEYLYWMGMVQDGPNNTWHVPELYLDLIRGKGGAV